jgi:AraC-like DNA-binding protein
LAPVALGLLSNAQAKIERLLENPELSAAMLQKLLRVSRGTLYELFMPNGGVQAYIRERRLQRCYEILRSNQRPNDTIGTVAFSLGFRSEAHFSRAFKERFGLSPRTLRLESRRRSGDLQPALVEGIAPHMIQALVRGDAK